MLEIPADEVPAELKPVCEQILKRARELRTADPVMSYWCCFAAASSSMTAKRSDESTKFLVRLLDVLEEMKSQLLGPDSSIEHATITDEAAGSAYVENFAMKVFLTADNEDRAGKAGKGTIRKFVVAAQFIEVLRCFEGANGMRDETEQKLRYAKWKAGDIAKALREGRKPTPGPPGGDDEDQLPNFPEIGGASFAADPSASSPRSPPSGGDEAHAEPASHSTTGLAAAGPSTDRSETSVPAPNFPRIGSSLARTDSVESSRWSTVATPGLPVSDQGKSDIAEGAVGLDEAAATTEPALDHLDTADQDPLPDGKKAVRFAGPDGASLSPTTTLRTIDSMPETEAPPSSEVEAASTRSTIAAAPPPSTVAESAVDNDEPAASSLPSAPTVVPSAPANMPSAPFLPPTPSAPPLPPAPSFAPSHPTGLPPPPSAFLQTPSAPSAAPQAPPNTPLPQKLEQKAIERTQKHAKWAISALDYDDLDTARAELRKALAILEGRATV